MPFCFCILPEQCQRKEYHKHDPVIIVVAIANIYIPLPYMTASTSSFRMTSLLVRTPVERRVPAVECAAMMLVEGHAAGIGKYSQTPPPYWSPSMMPRSLSNLYPFPKRYAAKRTTTTSKKMSTPKSCSKPKLPVPIMRIRSPSTP